MFKSRYADIRQRAYYMFVYLKFKSWLSAHCFRASSATHPPTHPQLERFVNKSGNTLPVKAVVDVYNECGISSGLLVDTFHCVDQNLSLSPAWGWEGSRDKDDLKGWVCGGWVAVGGSHQRSRALNIRRIDQRAKDEQALMYREPPLGDRFFCRGNGCRCF